MDISFLSSYPPKKCGVGEFCFDLAQGLLKNQPSLAINVYAIDDIPQGYIYDPVVKSHFYYLDQSGYKNAAKLINSDQSKICILQHEFNLFGGQEYSYLYSFVDNLNKPLIVVVHNIPIDKKYKNFDERKKHLLYLNKYVKHFVTMSKVGKNALINLGISEKKVTVINHGLPDDLITNRLAEEKIESSFSFQDKFVVAQFGLLHKNKNIESLLEGISLVRKAIPNILCLIIGVEQNGGDLYINKLKNESRSLGIEKIVKFVTSYPSREDLYRWLNAANVLITPYLRKDQISSGVLTFYMGVGKPIITTRYLYAQELLEKIGIFVPFADSKAISVALLRLASDKEYYLQKKNLVCKKGESLIWSKQAKKYLDLIQKIS